MVDNVNNPPHYTKHPSGVEAIQITEHMGFNLGNAMKYLWRADLKNDVIEDLKKAVWYVNREILKREKEQHNGKASEKQNEGMAQARAEGERTSYGTRWAQNQASGPKAAWNDGNARHAPPHDYGLTHAGLYLQGGLRSEAKSEGFHFSANERTIGSGYSQSSNLRDNPITRPWASDGRIDYSFGDTMNIQTNPGVIHLTTETPPDTIKTVGSDEWYLMLNIMNGEKLEAK